MTSKRIFKGLIEAMISQREWAVGYERVGIRVRWFGVLSAGNSGSNTRWAEPPCCLQPHRQHLLLVRPEGTDPVDTLIQLPLELVYHPAGWDRVDADHGLRPRRGSGNTTLVDV